MIKTLLKPLSFLPALMLMYMIYSFSAQPGEVSSALSYKVSYKIVQTADYIFDGGHGFHLSLVFAAGNRQITVSRQFLFYYNPAGSARYALQKALVKLYIFDEKKL